MPRRSRSTSIEKGPSQRPLRVFLSYHDGDLPAAESLGQWLQARVDLFLERWSLPPGALRQEEVERALEGSDAFVFLFGAQGAVGWQNEELRAALALRVEKPGFPVVPVLLPASALPESGKLPLFLRGTTFVDFRDGLDDKEEFHRLLCGVQGIAPGPPPGRPRLPLQCPYRGLEAFRVDDHPFFCGRGAVLQQILERFREERLREGGTTFLTVLGPSGSGKSSLVMAGLIPALEAGRPRQRSPWSIVWLRPGGSPIHELAMGLEGILPSGEEPWEEVLRSPVGSRERKLGVQIASALAKRGLDRLLLIVDQLEEVFTLCRDPERQSFLDLLLEASPTGGRAVVVVTLRDDFYGQGAKYLNPRMTEGAIPIPAMTLRELRDAIEQPAHLVGLRLETGLADQIVQDMSHQPEALPLLEHALLELYERRKGRKLTRAAYEEIQRISGAISKRAEKVFATLTVQEQRVARYVFLRLVQPGDGTADVRRQALLSELTSLADGGLVEPVIDRLVQARLLTRQRNARGEVVVDLIHEALVREWKRLREWIEQDRKTLLVLEDLRGRAQEWEDLKRPAGDLLRDERLALVELWLGDHPDLLDELEQRFLAASRDLKKREDELRELEARRREEDAKQRAEEAEARLGEKTRLVRWLRSISAGLVLFLIVSVFMTVFFGVTRREAKRQERLARAGELAAQSALRADSPLLSLLLGVEAAHIEPGALTTQEALRGALARIEGEGLPGLPRDLLRPSLSRDGRRLAAVTDENRDTVEVWNLEGATARRVHVVKTARPLPTLAVSEDGKWLAVGGMDRVTVHDLSVPGAPVAEEWVLPPGSLLYELAVTGDGRRFAGIGSGGLILAGLDGGSTPVLFSTPILSMALDTENRRIAAGGKDGLLFLVDMDAPDRVVPLPIWEGNAADVVGVAFNRDGSRLVASRTDGTVQVWALNLETGPQVVRTVRGSTGSAAAIAWSPDGLRLATGGGDGKVFLWELYAGMGEPRSSTLRGHEAALTALAFASSGRALLSVAVDGTCRRWDVDGLGVAAHPWRLAEVSGQVGIGLEYGWRDSGRTGFRLDRGGVYSLVGHVLFDPNRPWLVAGLGADTAALWRLGLPRPSSCPLSRRGVAVEAAAFSSRGAWMAWGRRDGRVFLRSLDGTTQKPLTPHAGPVTSLTFSPDGRWLASGGTDGRVRLWHPDRFPLAAGELEPVPGLPVRSIEISPDSRWLVVTHDGEGTPGNLDLWRLDKPESAPLVLSRSSPPLAAARFTPDGRWLITADQEGQGCLWDLAAGEPSCRLLSAGAVTVTGLAVSPDSRWLATGSGQSPEMRLWNLKADSPEASPIVLQGGGKGSIEVAAFSPGSRWLATGTDEADGRRGSIRLWDLDAGDPSEEPWSLSSPISGVSALAFGPKDRWLAAGGSNKDKDKGELVVWDLAAGAPGGETRRIALDGHTDRITTVAFSSDGRFLASADLRNVARLWALSLDDLTELACRAAGRDLTPEELDQYFPGESHRSVCARRAAGRRR